MEYGQFSYVYDRLMEDMPYSEWLRFLQTCWERTGKIPETLVELGCGTGNISIPIAESGIRVTGIDLSEDMLAVAQDKWDRRKSSGAFKGAHPIRWIQQDVCHWHLPEPCDCVVSFCDVFNYIQTEDDLQSAFQHTYNGLRENGLFIFDMLSVHQFQQYASEEPFLLDEEDIAYIWHCTWDDQAQRIEHDLTIFAKENNDFHHEERFVRIQEHHTQRAYDPDQVERMLRQAGFGSIYQCADFQFREPSLKSGRYFFIALKTKP